MAFPNTISDGDENTHPNYIHSFYTLMNNAYFSFIVCSMIKFLFYIVLYKIYIIIKEITNRFNSNSKEVVV